MLAVSWLACGTSIRIFKIRGRRAGLSMGVIAFALLMIAELALSIIVFRRSSAEFLREFGTPAGAIGFMSQAAYGIMPLLRSARANNRAAR